MLHLSHMYKIKWGAPMREKYHGKSWNEENLFPLPPNTTKRERGRWGTLLAKMGPHFYPPHFMLTPPFEENVHPS